MPELPEVERVRATLTPHVVGHRVTNVDVRRCDVVRGSATPEALLAGMTIVRIDRCGKQLALIGRPHPKGEGQGDGRCVCIHLGMSGSLRWSAEPQAATHTHVIWQLNDGSALMFRDPRRFGGVWTFPSTTTLLEQRWSKLGPDALTITPGQLHQVLSRKRPPLPARGRNQRSLKAALLDQGIVAGLGNIYVDELLFACRLAPTREAGSLDVTETRQLVRRMRSLLRRAVDAGGSTLRDYVDGQGRAGGFQHRHRVYGRGGQSCLVCGRPLKLSTVAGRTTVSCETCQYGSILPDR